jgi:FtsZ-interacting cell division protein YlmF
LLQLDDASPEEVQRIVDVPAADGALHGQVQRVGECIFRATAGVMVSQI